MNGVFDALIAVTYKLSAYQSYKVYYATGHRHQVGAEFRILPRQLEFIVQKGAVKGAKEENG